MLAREPWHCTVGGRVNHPGEVTGVALAAACEAGGIGYNRCMNSVYVETSFFSACVSRRQTPKSVGWRASSLEWWEKERQYFEVVVSAEVVAELRNPRFRQSDEAIVMLNDLDIAAIGEQVLIVADLLVEQKVMPGPAVSGDAVHVAFAIVHRIPYILTWNIRHLANPNKRAHLEVICMKLGMTAPQLLTPDLLKGSVGNG
jgi:predicted nucleic acid-binding protein